MKQLFTLLGILYFTTILNAQQIEPVFELAECGAAVLINEEPFMAVVENIGDTPNLALYNLEKKELMKRYKCQLPENPIAYIIPCDDGILYLVTMKKNDGQGPPFFDAIYGFDHKKDQIKLYYKEKEDVYIPRSANAVHSKLVLYRGTFSKQPLIFNTKTLAFEPFSDDESLRMLFSTDEGDAYVVFKTTEVRADDTVPVYVMKRDGTMSSVVGSYDSRMTLSTNEEENRLPGITITNSEYSWVNEKFNRSGLPLSGFAIATRSGLAKIFNKFSNMYDISELSSATANYVLAKSKHTLFVYDVRK
ncbi:hypothetical protein [Marinifilum fragile]|uniref:hypothetical protein n=1 Tax=Marinifilum fragile TaxID=570161 RepID=UPI002AA8CFB3|nr:hypothetical protein [Marinifilum fragile]